MPSFDPLFTLALGFDEFKLRETVQHVRLPTELKQALIHFTINKFELDQFKFNKFEFDQF